MAINNPNLEIREYYWLYTSHERAKLAKYVGSLYGEEGYGFVDKNDAGIIHLYFVHKAEKIEKPDWY